MRYNGDKIGQGRENAKNYLTEHPDIMEELDHKIRKHYAFEDGEEEEEQTETQRKLRKSNDSHQSGTTDKDKVPHLYR